jgi:hypothetical protein
MRARTSGRRSGGRFLGGWRRGGRAPRTSAVALAMVATACSNTSSVAALGRVTPLTFHHRRGDRGIGRQLLQQAVAAGHDVTAVARNPRRLPVSLLAGVRVVTADLAAPDPSVGRPPPAEQAGHDHLSRSPG